MSGILYGRLQFSPVLRDLATIPFSNFRTTRTTQKHFVDFHRCRFQYGSVVGLYWQHRDSVRRRSVSCNATELPTRRRQTKRAELVLSRGGVYTLRSQPLVINPRVGELSTAPDGQLWHWANYTIAYIKSSRFLRRPYNLYCVGGDVKRWPINQSVDESACFVLWVALSSTTTTWSRKEDSAGQETDNIERWLWMPFARWHQTSLHFGRPAGNSWYYLTSIGGYPRERPLTQTQGW